MPTVSDSWTTGCLVSYVVFWKEEAKINFLMILDVEICQKSLKGLFINYVFLQQFFWLRWLLSSMFILKHISSIAFMWAINHYVRYVAAILCNLNPSDFLRRQKVWFYNTALVWYSSPKHFLKHSICFQISFFKFTYKIGTWFSNKQIGHFTNRL